MIFILTGKGVYDYFREKWALNGTVGSATAFVSSSSNAVYYQLVATIINTNSVYGGSFTLHVLGGNAYNQLGLQSFSESATQVGTITTIETTLNVTQVSTMGNGTLLVADGKVYAAGLSTNGRLGSATSFYQIFEAPQFAGLNV